MRMRKKKKKSAESRKVLSRAQVKRKRYRPKRTPPPESPYTFWLSPESKQLTADANEVFGSIACSNAAKIANKAGEEKIARRENREKRRKEKLAKKRLDSELLRDLENLEL